MNSMTFYTFLLSLDFCCRNGVRDESCDSYERSLSIVSRLLPEKLGGKIAWDKDDFLLSLDFCELARQHRVSVFAMLSIVS